MILRARPRRARIYKVFIKKTKREMAQLKDIIEVENSRNGDTTSIHLFAEGMFYRAYEWSAWLCCRYVNEFKVTRRELKNGGGSVVFIGFPVTSLSKFLPEGVDVEQDEGRVTLRLPQGSHAELEDGTAAEAFANWKNSIPAVPQQRKTNFRDELRNNPDNEPRRMSDIMMSILAFQVEQKTPLECMAFIAELKSNISRLM